MPIKKLTLSALFTTASLAVYTIESAIPPLVPLPGVKLGLANIITLILLKHFPCRDALMVLTARILLAAFFFGQALSLAYSLAGGLLSLAVMAFSMKLLHRKNTFLTGALGGLAHNLGQLAAACAVTSSPAVLTYAPLLILSGILTGVFTGLCAGMVDKYLSRILDRT